MSFMVHHAGEMRTWIEQDIVTDNLKSSEEMLPRICESSIAYIAVKKTALFWKSEEGRPSLLR
jgi:hypothetical protein